MSLQKTGDSYQGAVYPFSREPVTGSAPDQGLLGPLCAAVSPTGELYVGGIRDSGWGGGNNIGEVVKLRYDEQTVPAGLAEMRATSTGFLLTFTRPLDPERAGDPANYGLESYRRVSTPAYGGPDLDRRIEKITRVKLIEQTATGATVQLELDSLRPGHVYELRLKNLTAKAASFFPAEAYFTLRKIP
jgi:hypothetical protein